MVDGGREIEEGGDFKMLEMPSNNQSYRGGKRTQTIDIKRNVGKTEKS